MRALETLVVVLTILACTAYGKRQLYCPNNGTPKNGIVCLPGQTENNVCGEGYSCFFSGLNYHCCPTGDESANKEPLGECPDYTVALLDSNGNPVHCSSLGKDCPEKNMYCNENSPVPICCQKLKTENQKIPMSEQNQEQQVLQAVEDFFNDDQSSSSKQESEKDNAEPECPKNSLTVLTEDRGITFCASKVDCPQSSMFCYGSERKICCEPTGALVAAKEEHHLLNVQLLLTTPESSSTYQREPSSSPTTITTTTLSNLISTTDISLSTSRKVKTGPFESIHQNDVSGNKAGSKVFASKTAVLHHNKPPKYHPHVSGGYAVSQTINKLNDDNAVKKKEFVQQYLLQQIKQGWPYDEKFYRPRSTK